MRINEDYLDRVTIADIDDEDIDDAVESQEPSPGKWKFAMLLTTDEDNKIDSVYRRVIQIMKMCADDYNVYMGLVDKFVEEDPYVYVNGRRIEIIIDLDSEESIIVEFNCKSKPYIPIYALSTLKNIYSTYFLTCKYNRYSLSQITNPENLSFWYGNYDQDDVNELLVCAIVDMVENGNGQNYDDAELHEWVIKRQQERERKRRIK